MDAEAPLAPGVLLGGRYEIGKQLRQTLGATVFAARDVQRQVDCAVKLLTPPVEIRELSIARLRHEKLALKRLDHGRIVQLFELGTFADKTFVTSQRLPGETMTARVSREKTLPIDWVIQSAKVLAEAVAEAHRAGVLHRDIKPDSILFDKDGSAHLADFGTARLEVDSELWEKSRGGGSRDALLFAAPEVHERRGLDARTDVYGLGMTLYYALTGRTPNRPSESARPTTFEHGYRTKLIRSDVPAWLDEIIARATCADPKDRLPTAGAFALALETKGSGPAADKRVRFCLECGAVDALGTKVCSICLKEPRGRHPDLLFVKPKADDPDVGAFARSLGAPEGTSGLPEVLRSLRPLSFVRPDRSAEVIDKLHKHGVDTEVVAFSQTVTHLSKTVVGTAGLFLVAAVVLAFRGYRVAPALLVLGVLVAVLISIMFTRSPVFGAQRIPSGLPPFLETRVGSSLAQLRGDSVVGIVADIVGCVREAFLSAEERGAPVEVRTQLGEVVVAACETAAEVGHVDAILQRLDEKRIGRLDAKAIHSVVRAEAVRDGLVLRLLEVLQGLRVPKAHAAGDLPEEVQWAQLAAGLRSELALRRDANADIAAVADVAAMSDAGR
jgi:hypothetical protein